ncbi:MAG: FAD:protein FMN transferase [Lachnospiraceae bacterium]|nr:FAD:protein FMN transferase [Lachnospiraceae bacterium]
MGRIWNVKRPAFFPAFLLLFMGSVLLTGCQPKVAQPITRTELHLNTVVTVTIYDSADEALLDEAMALCEYYEAIFSRTLETAELARLNAAAKDPANTGQALPVSEDLAALIEQGLFYSELSGGAFDITLEPVSSLWDFSSAGEKTAPDPAAIEASLPLVDHRQVALETDPDSIIIFQQAGMGLDVGAIAKGYIADRMKEHLISRGVTSATINLGGNLLCIGEKTGDQPFKIGIQKPFADHSETIAYMEIRDASVVTSGIYERCFEDEGQFYHHLLNPQTGYPYFNDLISVTIVSPDSVDGDALSTACFALGLEEGMKLLDDLDGIYGVFITRDYGIYYSEGFLDAIPVTEMK